MSESLPTQLLDGAWYRFTGGQWERMEPAPVTVDATGQPELPAPSLGDAPPLGAASYPGTAPVEDCLSPSTVDHPPHTWSAAAGDGYVTYFCPGKAPIHPRGTTLVSDTATDNDPRPERLKKTVLGPGNASIRPNPPRSADSASDTATVLADLDRRGEIQVVGWYCTHKHYLSSKAVHLNLTCCRAVFYRPASVSNGDTDG